MVMALYIHMNPAGQLCLVKAGDESQTRGRDYNGQVIDVKVEGGPKAADDLRKLVLDLTDQVPGQPRDVRRVDDPIIKFIIGLDGSTFSWSAFLKLEPGNNLDFFVHTIEERRKLAHPDGASDDPVMSKIHLTTPTAPRRAVGFFRSGCSSGCPAELITQLTSDWQSFI